MLRAISGNLGVEVSPEMEKKLFAEYGGPVTDDEGHVFEYTEQDLCEQLRKKLLPYQNHCEEATS
jgi:hypothetical protein